MSGMRVPDSRDDLLVAWHRVVASLIAVERHLQTPYPDAPEWTPWTRFVKPALDGMEREMEIRKRAAS